VGGNAQRLRDWSASRVDTLLAVAITAAGLGIIMAISYQHEYTLALHNRQVSWVARLVPVSVDGMLIQASIALFWAGRHGIRWARREGPHPWPPLVTAAVGIVATIGANFVSDFRSPWLGPAVSGSAGVAAVLLGWVAMWMVETQRKIASGEPFRGPAACSCPRPATTLEDALPLAQRALREAGEPSGQEMLAKRFRVSPYQVRKVLATTGDGASLNGGRDAVIPPGVPAALNGDGHGQA